MCGHGECGRGDWQSGGVACCAGHLPFVAAAPALSAAGPSAALARAMAPIYRLACRAAPQIDATTLLALLVYHGASCFLPAFAGCRPDWLGSSLLPALTVLVPLQLLLLANRSHRWYSKHRDQLLMCTYVLLACHHALDLSSLAAAPGGMGQALALRVEASWCVVLGVILQVRRLLVASRCEGCEGWRMWLLAVPEACRVGCCPRCRCGVHMPPRGPA